MGKKMATVRFLRGCRVQWTAWPWSVMERGDAGLWYYPPHWDRSTYTDDKMMERLLDGRVRLQ
jgi:hypothetical protein